MIDKNIQDRFDKQIDIAIRKIFNEKIGGEERPVMNALIDAWKTFSTQEFKTSLVRSGCNKNTNIMDEYSDSHRWMPNNNNLIKNPRKGRIYISSVKKK